VPSPPYDSLETVLNTARARFNDAIVNIGGEILTDNAPFTLPLINAGWRRLQEYLASKNFQRLMKYAYFYAVPAAATADQGIFVVIDWTGYNPGSGPVVAAPALPQQMIYPMVLEERINGSLGNYTPVDQVFGGLPTVQKGPLNLIWEWSDENIKLPGATGLTDIRLRYSEYLADFLPASESAFAAQPVPIMRCLTSLAWFLCSEVARGRGDMDVAYFDQQAMSAAEIIFGRDYLPAQQVFKPAELAKMPDAITQSAGGEGRGQ
jgi:hypothetical protein